MIAFDVSKVTIAEVVVVQAVMYPLFGQIALNDSGQQHGRRVKGKDKAQGSGDHEERQQVFQHTIDMQTISGSFVMLPMQRVKALVSKGLVPLLVPDLRCLKPAMKDIAMSHVLDERPDRNSCQEEDYSQIGMRRAPRQHQQDDGISGIEGGDGIETAAGDRRLLTLVRAERFVNRATVRTHKSLS